jgi:hypothetical protein
MDYLRCSLQVKKVYEKTIKMFTHNALKYIKRQIKTCMGISSKRKGPNGDHL